MLNSNTGVENKSYNSVNQILASVEHQMSVGCIVSDDGISAVDGKKIVKAGTPLAGSLHARQVAFTALLSGTTGATGVLLHDVDVTAGPNNGTCLYFGAVNLNRVDPAVKAILSVSGVAAALRPLGIYLVAAN